MDKIIDKILNSRLAITGCWKDFVDIENDYIPIEIREQESDGNVLLEFSDDSLCLFYGVTEDNSLRVSYDLNLYNNDKSRFRDISHNNYWKKRIGVAINNVSIEKFEGTIYSITFHFSNELNTKISYEIETQYDFDCTVIR